MRSVTLNAKRVVLELMSVVGERPAPAAALVQACSLFGITENSTRVTLARLLAAGTIDATGRGEYRLSAAAEPIAREITGWRDLEKQMRKWDGGWVCVHTAALGRTDRSELRRRDRALRLLGFASFDSDLALRPDNLSGGVEAVRARLRDLGLDRGAIVFRGESFDARDDVRARALWDGEKLTDGYRKMRLRLERWLERGPSQAADTAARESFILGGDALRMLVFDPRLPEPLVDVSERRALIDTAKRFDATGRRIWERLFGVAHGLGNVVEVH
jgi:phenylacetic acid degradation operon negative regulatory protein